MPKSRWGFVAVLLLTPLGCGSGQNRGAPLRSPTVDYPLPPAQTSNGEVVGADRVPPQDKLATSPAAGSNGSRGAAPTSPPEAPVGGPGSVGTTPAHPPDPCAQIGLEDASGKSECGKAAPPR